MVEINTYEQLRELDHKSSQLKSDAIDTAARVLAVAPAEITDIAVLKKGMTNRSFMFKNGDAKYIMRIPGEGTDKLINRSQGAQVYVALSGKGICDNPVYINPENGYKITVFLEGIRICEPLDVNDLEKCMTCRRKFHEMKLKVGYEFDIFGQIEFYESLWDGKSSVYKDYAKTKVNVLSLKPYMTEAKCIS